MTLLQAVSIGVNELQSCNLSSVDMMNASVYDGVPCLYFDSGLENQSSIPITVVQITPSKCASFRDGAIIATTKLNGLNNNQGFHVGYTGSSYVQFRLVLIVAGDIDRDKDSYDSNHKTLLTDALLSELNVTYVLGTCNFGPADYEKDLVNDRILMAQVGPDIYYRDSSEFLFGIHVSSYGYTYPFIKDVLLNKPNSKFGIISRTESFFFNSTCASASSYILSQGSKGNLVYEYHYDPQGDDDNDSIRNEMDPDFLSSISSQMCSSGADIFIGCITTTEADIIIENWKKNSMCVPKAIWLTCTTWNWDSNEKLYLNGGGQWHHDFTYSDPNILQGTKNFFNGGNDLYTYVENNFGYPGQYDHAASYSIMLVFMEHLVDFFKVDDNPTYGSILGDYNKSFVRALVTLVVEATIYGRVSFNELRRNVGRVAAASQFKLDENDMLRDYCTAPDEVKSAAMTLPAPSLESCSPGQKPDFINSTACILCQKCSNCSGNQYSPYGASCVDCPSDSFTYDSVICNFDIEDIITRWSFIVCNALGCLVIVAAISCAAWSYFNRSHVVLKLSQTRYLYVLCGGVTISTISIFFFSRSSTDPDDVDSLSTTCMLIPWFLSIGTSLTFSSLFAKTWRLGKIVNNSKMKRMIVTDMHVAFWVCLSVTGDIIIMICWSLIDPLFWEINRRVLPVSPGGEMFIVVQVSAYCTTKNSSWIFLGPLFVYHFISLIIGLLILYRARNIKDTFQEGKYIRASLISTVQLLVLAIPVLIAVDSNYPTEFVLVSLIVILSQCSVLGFIFIPKITAVSQLGPYVSMNEINLTREPRSNDTDPPPTTIDHSSVSYFVDENSKLREEVRVLSKKLTEAQGRASLFHSNETESCIDRHLDTNGSLLIQ